MPPLTINTRKRTKADASPEPAPKKKRGITVPPTKDHEVIHVLDNEDPATVHITVKLHSKFESFPTKLRSILTYLYQKTVLAQMDELHSHKPQKLNYDYTLLIGESASPSTTGGIMPFHPTTTPKTPHLSIANTQLLEAFVAQYGTNFSKDSFVELAKQDGMANREFIHLHTVRHGEVGWGFDAHGCLSLYCAKIEGKVLRKVVYFVERTERTVKVEIEDD